MATHDDELAAAEHERSLSIQNWVGWTIVLGASLLVFISLNPPLLLTDSTATGGDMGAHVWGPRFLMDHLLPSLRVTGWTPDWYAGFPAYMYYMVVPSLFVVWLSFGSGMWEGGALAIVAGIVLRVALMAAVVLGARALLRQGGGPLVPAAGLGGCAVRRRTAAAHPVQRRVQAGDGLGPGHAAHRHLPVRPSSEGALPRTADPGDRSLFFIYDKGFTILGGNGASTMAGEFAFSISLTFAFLFLAVVFRGIRTGRDRALGAVLFALTILCHLIPAIFVVIVTVVLLFVRREDRTPWWDASVVGRASRGCSCCSPCCCSCRVTRAARGRPDRLGVPAVAVPLGGVAGRARVVQRVPPPCSTTGAVPTVDGPLPAQRWCSSAWSW